MLYLSEKSVLNYLKNTVVEDIFMYYFDISWIKHINEWLAFCFMYDKEIISIRNKRMLTEANQNILLQNKTHLTVKSIGANLIYCDKLKM